MQVYQATYPQYWHYFTIYVIYRRLTATPTIRKPDPRSRLIRARILISIDNNNSINLSLHSIQVHINVLQDIGEIYRVPNQPGGQAQPSLRSDDTTQV